MKPLTVRELEKILKANGFVHHRTRGSHFIWLNPTTGLSIPVPHHGNQSLKQGLLLGIFRSANIPPPQR